MLDSQLIEDIADGTFRGFALLAGLELGVFTRLAARHRTVAELAGDLDAEEWRVRALLHALVSIGLLERDGDRFRTTPDYVGELAEGGSQSIAGRAPLWRAMWRAGLDASDAVLRGGSQHLHDFAAMSESELEHFLRALHDDALRSGEAIDDLVDLASCRHLGDFGGGSGGVAVAALRRHAALEATIVEVENVVPVTRRLVDELGDDVAGRVRVAAAGELVPETFDVVVLKAVLQTVGADDAGSILDRVFASMCDGGELVILGRGILENDRERPLASVLINLALLGFYREGRGHTIDEHREWLEAAGFGAIEVRRQAGASPVICVRK